MKVKCIDSVWRGWNNTYKRVVYSGKEYDVLKEAEDGYIIRNEVGVLAGYPKEFFEKVEKVEKEKVLEIEFQDVFDKVAWKITYQNTDVLPRNRFEDRELGVRSCIEPNNDRECLFLRGDLIEEDNKVCIATKKEAEIIKHKLDAINDKYGIPKRWRAKKGGEYWYIHISSKPNCLADIEGEHAPLGDNPFRHVDRYNCGNYFRTRDEALSKLHEIEKIFAK